MQRLFLCHVRRNRECNVHAQNLFSDQKRHGSVVLSRIFIILGGSGGWQVPSECVWIQWRWRWRSCRSGASCTNLQRDEVQHSGSGQRQCRLRAVLGGNLWVVVQLLLKIVAESWRQRRLECRHWCICMECYFFTHVGEARLTLILNSGVATYGTLVTN